MQIHVFQALILILVAAVMNATYTLPMKLNHNWKWEHSWCAFSILGVVAVPALIAFATVPDLLSVYSEVPLGSLLGMAIFGAGWGVSMVFFGLSLRLVGVSVAFTVSLTTSAAAGALLPLLMKRPERLLTAQGATLLTGILLIIVGVTFCGIAGLRRQRLSGIQEEGAKNGFVRGFSFALISGVLGSLLNLGLAYGDQIQETARRHGASAVMTSNAVWLPCIVAGFLPSVIYCLHIMRKHGTGGEFFKNARYHYWLMAACMGLLWYGSILLYGFSARSLGDIGAAIAWPLFLSAIVIMSVVVGLFTGEWKPSSTGPFRTLLFGLLVLLIAIGVLSEAGRISG